MGLIAVQATVAGYEGRWEFLAIRAVTALTAALIRPDGQKRVREAPRAGAVYHVPLDNFIIIEASAFVAFRRLVNSPPSTLPPRNPVVQQRQCCAAGLENAASRRFERGSLQRRHSRRRNGISWSRMPLLLVRDRAGQFRLPPFSPRSSPPRATARPRRRRATRSNSPSGGSSRETSAASMRASEC